MLMLKKLILAPVFLLVFIFTIYQITPFLKSYDLIFSLSVTTLIQLIIISGSILLSSFSFVLFSIFSLDWKFVLPLGVLSSLIPFLFLTPALGVVFMVGIIVSLLLTYLSLESAMKSYLTFQPATLLGPSIRHLTSLLILIICIVYFFSINTVVQQNGFQIPDSLIDTALKVTNQTGSNQQETQSPLPSLSPEQIELLRKNPQLLRQSGLDPKILDTLNSPKTQNTSNDLIKQTIKDQVQSFLKSYLGFIPSLLAVLLFLTFQGITSLMNLLIYPLLWIIFYILEKSGFITFTQEMRPVKKMAV